MGDLLKKIDKDMKLSNSVSYLKINQPIIIYVAGKKTNAKVKSINEKEKVIDATANNKTYFCTFKNNKWIAKVN
ncbi:MAG: hypothetical protein PHC93_04575 [Candidatus Omnitrophica bacterium]|nr:hypothetical protein [Candidatus Omnitrophota bacterium]